MIGKVKLTGSHDPKERRHDPTLDEPIIKTLAPWYGSNRSCAEHVGRMFKGIPLVGIAFAGGMSEAIHIDARTLLINDLHSHVVNLARVAADDKLGPQLWRRLRRIPFHGDELLDAQTRCQQRTQHESGLPEQPLEHHELLDWAVDYFVSCWLARSATAGTAGEFQGGLALRFTTSGGDSAVRYQNAVRSLNAWRRILRRATFTTLDVFDWLDQMKDRPTVGIYCDPPFLGPGDKYHHKFGESKHVQLAERLGRFEHARVVCRFYERPLVGALYPRAAGWTHHKIEGGRKQSNAAAPELLVTNAKSA